MRVPLEHGLSRITKRRVMIVDDDEAARNLTVRLIEQEGYEAIPADSEASAIRLASKSRITAFLLCMDSPEVDSAALCGSIRAMPDYKLAPIIFVGDMGSNLGKVFAAGYDDLINKPIDPLVLRARLNGHIQRADSFNQLDRTRKMLDQYLSKRTREVAEIAAQTGVLPSPTQREVVILFTDIRGFTALSEEMEPDLLFSLLNAQLALQVDLVYKFGGYVDKFGGDGLMAIFDGDSEMAVRSCLCALQIMASEEQSDRRMGQLGIGIHMGRVVIGNLGSSEHLDYSAIGNAVNLAARLCGHASPMSIVVSKTVRDATHGDLRVGFETERAVTIRGIKEPVTVYTLSQPHK